MSIKVELHSQLKEFGYELSPFTSKETLTTMRCLHTIVLENRNIDVPQLNDAELRKCLIESGLSVGPITNYTRAIYQRKLLEALANQTVEKKDDEDETDESNTLYPNLSCTKPSTLPYATDYAERTGIRHGYKATDSPVKTSSQRNTLNDTTEIRTRIPKKPNEPIPKKIEDFSTVEDDGLKVQKKSGSGVLTYTMITIMVALIVFFAYLWFEK